MNIKLIYKLSGILSVALGILAACSVFRLQWLYYGIAISMLGIILGCINIFLYMKYFSEQQTTPRGFLGIFLCSLPILFLVFVVFKFRK